MPVITGSSCEERTSSPPSTLKFMVTPRRAYTPQAAFSGISGFGAGAAVPSLGASEERGFGKEPKRQESALAVRRNGKHLASVRAEGEEGCKDPTVPGMADDKGI